MERSMTEVLERLKDDAAWVRGEYEKYRDMARTAEGPDLFASQWMMREIGLGIEAPLESLRSIAENVGPRS